MANAKRSNPYIVEDTRKRLTRPINIGNDHTQEAHGEKKLLGAKTGILLPMEEQHKNKKFDNAKYMYGNYPNYYENRRNKSGSADPRLHVLDRTLFENKQVLDIGCNSGNISIIIAMSFAPAHVLGIDIDEGLIKRANQLLRSAYSLQKPQGENIDLINHDLSLRFHYFPRSMTSMYGFIPMKMPPNSNTDVFPWNITFEARDWMEQEVQASKYDTVLALSITKWIQLHRGDEGLKAFFQRVYDCLKPSGVLVLEPQEFKSYQRRAKQSESTKQVFANISFKPEDYEQFLLEKVGFSKVEHLGKQDGESKGYLFGNVDEEGRMDNDLDEDLRETLQHVDAGVMSKIFNDDALGFHQENNEMDEDSGITTDREQSQPTFHSKDAVDYSDFNEAVPDDQAFSDKYFKRGMSMIQKSMPRSRLSLVSDNYDDEETTEPPVITSVKSFSIPSQPLGMGQIKQTKISMEKPADDIQREPKTSNINELFPGFEKGKILKFSELFTTKLTRPPRLRSQKQVTLTDGFEYEVERDDRVNFNRAGKTDRVAWDLGKSSTKRRKMETEREIESSLSSDSESEDDMTREVSSDMTQYPMMDMDNNRYYHAILLEKWEDRIQWGNEAEAMEDEDISKNLPVTSKHINHQLFDGTWLNSAIWDKVKPDASSMRIILDLNDPHMLFDCEEVEATKTQLFEPKQVKKGRKPLPRPLLKIPIIYSDNEPHSKFPLDRFNLSNDKFYDAHYTGRLVRIRQTFGQLVVYHAFPALKLHPAFYKTKLSKAELRSFHRPLIQLPVGTDIQFSRVKISKKKKKDKKKGFADAMRTTRDLSLKDTSPFVLVEYTEEHPHIISNFGMGTLIINYYRKTEPKDEHVPSNDIGEPFVLDIGDTSPFMNFGNVEPGQTISVFYNNLVRAPLFRHDVRRTDFLLVKSTYKGHTKYYLREIPAIFLIGQTYPVQEVPGPHSRKVTTTIKNRLQVVAYRLIKKNPQQRLKMSKLSQKFPEYSDIQIRQRLKEFLEFHRRNKDGGGGYWKTRGGGDPPDEEELRKMATPEMVCLYESMLVGERHLQDLGYGDVNDDDETGEGDSKLEVEQQLAPWFATRNFINASQGKAMLKLYGAGDPTGRGEGFSFIRVSMKDIFLRAGESAEEKLAQIEARPKSAHRYNVAEQQQIYREEIARIWKAQFDALSSKEEPILSDRDAEDDSGDEAGSPSASEADWGRRPSTPMGSGRRMDRALSESVDDDDVSVTGSLSSRTSYHMNNPNKQLVIRRLIRQKNGEKSWQQEVVRDPVVIKSYLRQRRMIEEEASNTEVLEPTDDEEKNARMKKRIQDQLAKLKRNAERRRQRQLAKNAALAENPVLGLIRGKREGAMRRCGNCGQLGHMKTNKNCPMFYVVNGPNGNNNSAPPVTASTPSADGNTSGGDGSAM